MGGDAVLTACMCWTTPAVRLCTRNAVPRRPCALYVHLGPVPLYVIRTCLLIAGCWREDALVLPLRQHQRVRVGVALLSSGKIVRGQRRHCCRA